MRVIQTTLSSTTSASSNNNDVDKKKINRKSSSHQIERFSPPSSYAAMVPHDLTGKFIVRLCRQRHLKHQTERINRTFVQFKHLNEQPDTQQPQTYLQSVLKSTIDLLLNAHTDRAWVWCENFRVRRLTKSKPHTNEHWATAFTVTHMLTHSTPNKNFVK